MGLLPLFAPYDLLLQPATPDVTAPFPWTPLLISLGALLVSLLFLTAAFFGREQRVASEAATAAVIHTYRTAVIGSRTVRHPFASIEGLGIVAHAESDGPALYNIQVDIVGGERIEFGRFDGREEAEYYLAKVGSLIGKQIDKE